MEKKLIELDPEWVIENFSISQGVFEDGKMFVQTDRIIESSVIHFLLESLKIDFEIDGDIEEEDECIFEFRIEDIKIDCPSLYAEMIRLNIKFLEEKLKSVN